MDVSKSNLKETGFELLFTRLKGPLKFIVPVIVCAISFLSIRDTFGNVWDTGGFSLPVILFIITAIANIAGIDSELVLSTFVIVFYALGPLTFYFFVYLLTKRQLPAFLTGLLTILPFNPLSLNPPNRLVSALVDKDGGHIISLTFIPLTALLFLKYIKTNKSLWLIFFEISVIMLSLVSLFSLYVLVTFMVFMTLSEMLIGMGKHKLVQFLKALGVAVVLSAVVYNKFLLTIMISSEGKTTIAVFLNFLPLMFFIVPVFGTFAFLIFDRRPQLQPLFLALTLSLVFGLLHFVRVTFADITILESQRYAAETSLAVAFFIGLSFQNIFDLIREVCILSKYPLLYTHRLFVATIFITVVLTLLMGSALFVTRSII